MARARRWLRRAALLSIALPLLASVYLAGSILLYARHSSVQSADVAIVLGAGVESDGLTPVFEQRVRHAVDLYRTRRVRALILTGGVGQGDTLAESEVARSYCLAHGVALRDIAIETVSRTTFENLLQARSLLQARGWRRALLVSDPLHMRRAITQARDLGIDAHPSPTPTSRYRSWHSRGRFAARELYFYAKYLLTRMFGAD